jgi:hypothetical protein
MDSDRNLGRSESRPDAGRIVVNCAPRSREVVGFRSRRRGFEPLSSDPRIGKAAEKVHQRVPVTWKGGYFAGALRREFRSELGELRVRQASMPMMDAMIWLMEQTEGYQPAEQPF